MRAKARNNQNPLSFQIYRLYTPLGCNPRTEPTLVPGIASRKGGEWGRRSSPPEFVFAVGTIPDGLLSTLDGRLTI